MALACALLLHSCATPGPAAAIQFDCISLEERLRVLSKDITTDSVEFERISKEIAATRLGFLNDAQRFALSQRSSYVQYIKKQLPVNMASLKQELVRARRYNCSTEEKLKLLEAEAAKAADLVASTSLGK